MVDVHGDSVLDIRPSDLVESHDYTLWLSLIGMTRVPNLNDLPLRICIIAKLWLARSQRV